jgi:glycosyltransferase involved in cell wall biosynthesis
MDEKNRQNYPLVSIVTPSFNSYPYIIENIESVKTQDYPNIEHIIIDGGSSDGTIEVLKKYSHLVWISEKDNGQSEAINKGFKMAKGEIIGWLNSDDFYNCNAVSFAVKYFNENSMIDLIFSDENVVDEESKVIKIRKGEDITLEKILSKNVVRQPTIFMRRKVIEILKGVREDLHYVMDRELWLRALLYNFNFKYVEGKILANFRYCQGTKSKEMPVSFGEEWIKVLDEYKNDEHLEKNKRKVFQTAVKRERSFLMFSKMVKDNRENKFLNALLNFAKGIAIYKRNMFRLGVWKLLTREILIKMRIKKG